VFVEKPLCITEAELERIAHVVDTLRAAGQAPFVMVGFNRRFAPSSKPYARRWPGRP
jgi:predicted dehydrogenase